MKEYQLLDDEDGRFNAGLRANASSQDESIGRKFLGSGKVATVLCLLLLTSLSINLNFVLHRGASQAEKCKESDCISKWANLVTNVTKPFYPETKYGKLGTQEVRDKLWRELDISIGLIHLPHDWAADNGLPRSQVFPWDRSQGIYYPAAYHQLHCLKDLYFWLSNAEQGRPQVGTYEHTMHCMDTLLQDVWCHADDTPWYQPPPEWEKHGYEKIQYRQCRDFDQLLSWVKERYACYKHYLEDDGGDYLEHYHFCPENSPYRSVMEKHFERKAAQETQQGSIPERL